LIEIVEDLHQRDVGFQVLTGVEFDTSTPHGRFAFQLFGAWRSMNMRSLSSRCRRAWPRRVPVAARGRRPKLSPSSNRRPSRWPRARFRSRRLPRRWAVAGIRYTKRWGRRRWPRSPSVGQREVHQEKGQTVGSWEKPATCPPTLSAWIR
jgi:DNA invertase Pin-like site-specific DNA recombinase